MNVAEYKVVYCGIDISKLTFDTFISGKSNAFKNNLKGFKKFIELLPEHAHCVMEATGPYYLKLAVYLQSNGLQVSVVNPLVIKRFSQMRMIKAKTDKADAMLIALYAEKESPKLWIAPKSVLLKIQQEQAVLEGMKKQVRSLNNQMESIQVQPSQSQEALKVLAAMVDIAQKQIDLLEASILDKAQKAFPKELELITSIPGIGIKTAIALLVSTDAFSKFKNGKQVASYIGICPRIYQSGSSINGKGHITKMGDPRARTLLYMGACSAKKHNLACQQLYDRLVKNGKAKKLALIAVANKLVKQAYAVVTQESMYNPEYYSVLNRSLS